jgi:hypothetical protein
MINKGQSAEYNGIWWLPIAEDRTLHGILRYTPNDGFELEVIGSFIELPELLLGPQTLEIIQGTSLDGKSITLYRGF